jgi:hypothetical protein
MVSSIVGPADCLCFAVIEGGVLCVDWYVLCAALYSVIPGEACKYVVIGSLQAGHHCDQRRLFEEEGQRGPWVSGDDVCFLFMFVLSAGALTSLQRTRAII